MNIEPMHEKELVRLCGLMVDGQLGDADTQHLSELLSADASARAFYRSYMDAHARLLLHYEPVPVLHEPTEEPVRRLVGKRKPHTRPTSWWQVSAAALLLLITGLNVIQSAGNLEAARGLTTPQTTRMTDADARRLAEEIGGLTPSDVKRIAILNSRREGMLMLPVSRR
jgi:anti-sigma factor RsiW